LEGLVEVAVGQDARAQAEDVVAQVADDPVQLLDGVLEAGTQVVVAGQQGRALQAHPDREQGLDGAVVQLLGDPLAVLEHGQPVQLALEPGVLQGDRGLLGEGLDQLHVGVAQRRAALGVRNRQRAEGGAAYGQGDEQRRADPRPDDRLDAARVGPGVGQSHRLAGAQHLPGHRPRGREGCSSELLGEDPVGGLDHQPVGPRGQGEGGQVGADQLPGLAHHQGEQLGGVDAGKDRAGDGPDRLQPPGAVPGLLVQLGVLDRHPGLGGQQDQGPLIVGVEVLTATLLGQIQVAVHLPTSGDRDAEERPHRRMVGWEADRPGVLGEVVQAQRPGVVDQHPEDAAADRDVADRRPLGVADSSGDELGDDAVPPQHAERPVAGIGELRGQLDDALQGGRERQLGGEGQPGLQQALVPLMDACHRRQPTPLVRR
jgi:hypothetical protein